LDEKGKKGKLLEKGLSDERTVIRGEGGGRENVGGRGVVARGNLSRLAEVAWEKKLGDSGGTTYYGGEKYRREEENPSAKRLGELLPPRFECGGGTGGQG